MRALQTARGATLSLAEAPKAGIRLVALGVALLGLALDQLSKDAVLRWLEPGRPVEILGSALRFTLVRNPGAAFGLGSGATFALSLIAIAALLLALFAVLPRIKRPVHAVVLGMLLAGVAGNLHDRLLREPAPMHGHVVDFIQLPYFAIFNVADILITCSAALVILLGFRHESGENTPQGTPALKGQGETGDRGATPDETAGRGKSEADRTAEGTVG